MRQAVFAILLVLALCPAAMASGGGISVPWPIDPYGGSPAEQDAFYDGNTGILLGRAPWARLFAAWRMLHGLQVGDEAGNTLAEPCCGGGYAMADTAKAAWVAARMAVPNAKPIKDYQIDPFRQVGDFFAVPTCFPDAFNTAAVTLATRIADHGASDPWIKAWLDGQDKVFTACSEDVDLPPPDSAAPAWLKADAAYQAAAVALYSRHFEDAEKRFDVIAADPASPWHSKGPYLAARAAVDAALPSSNAAVVAHAREKLQALAAPEAYGHADLARLTGALDFRGQPDARRIVLTQALTGPALPANSAADFKDSRRLGQSPPGQPAYLDWIAVFGRIPDKPEAAWFDHYDVDQIWHSDAEALAHARDRWQATLDPAWLIATMAWTDPGRDAADLVTAATALPVSHPAYLTALYHRVRLGDPDAQAALETALARPDLSSTTRNLLTAERTLSARDIGDLARLAPRDSPCLTATGDEKGCVAGDYQMEILPASQNRPDIRFGNEAAAIIDRLPIQDRARLAAMPTLPAPLRLDVALTTWVRAVLAQDGATADTLAGALQTLLPQLGAEWKTYLSAKAGDDKAFAAGFILARLPGADVDLRDNYTRPQGAVADFDGHWQDWVYAPATAVPVPPSPVEGDLICFGMCGPGAFPLRLPEFVNATAAKAAQERGRYRPVDKAATGSVWEGVLAYAKAHPADPRSPEALYWLVRVSRYGTGHNRSSFRAWVLLHNRYPKSTWTAASKYFYD